jgi:hypothetical protein
MIMARLSVGCYEPLADADAHVSPIADLLVGVEMKLSSLGLEQSLYGERLGAVYVDFVGAKFPVNTGCRAENGSPIAGEAAAVIGARKNTPVSLRYSRLEAGTKRISPLEGLRSRLGRSYLHKILHK